MNTIRKTTIFSLATLATVSLMIADSSQAVQLRGTKLHDSIHNDDGRNLLINVDPVLDGVGNIIDNTKDFIGGIFHPSTESTQVPTTLKPTTSAPTQAPTDESLCPDIYNPVECIDSNGSRKVFNNFCYANIAGYSSSSCIEVYGRKLVFDLNPVMDGVGNIIDNTKDFIGDIFRPPAGSPTTQAPTQAPTQEVTGVPTQAPTDEPMMMCTQEMDPVECYDETTGSYEVYGNMCKATTIGGYSESDCVAAATDAPTDEPMMNCAHVHDPVECYDKITGSYEVVGNMCYAINFEGYSESDCVRIN